MCSKGSGDRHLSVSHCTRSKKKLGLLGERIALKYLLEGGYVLEALNWEGKRGELDLIMRYDQVLVFIEVRTTSTSWLSRPSEAVSSHKQKQVARCADEYLGKRPPTAPEVLDYRFDVIGILTPHSLHEGSEDQACQAHHQTSLACGMASADLIIDHIENAFTAPWAF